MTRNSIQNDASKWSFEGGWFLHQPSVFLWLTVLIYENHEFWSSENFWISNFRQNLRSHDSPGNLLHRDTTGVAGVCASTVTPKKLASQYLFRQSKSDGWSQAYCINIWICIFIYIYIIHIKLPRNLTFSRKNIWRKPPSWGSRQVETSFCCPSPSFKFRRSQVDLAKSLPSMLEDLGAEVHHLLPESEKAPIEVTGFLDRGIFGAPKIFIRRVHDFFSLSWGEPTYFWKFGHIFPLPFENGVWAHLVG